MIVVYLAVDLVVAVVVVVVLVGAIAVVHQLAKNLNGCSHINTPPGAAMASCPRGGLQRQ